MKVGATKIIVEIDIDEWKKIKNEWEPVIYGENTKPPCYSTTPSLWKFMSYIDQIARNPADKIDIKL